MESSGALYKYALLNVVLAAGFALLFRNLLLAAPNMIAALFLVVLGRLFDKHGY